jgi:hypothetical protein
VGQAHGTDDRLDEEGEISMRYRAIGLMLGASLWLTWSGSASAGELTAKQDAAGVTVTTARYEVRLAAKQGYTLRSLTDRRTRRKLSFARAGLVIDEERERAKWTGASFGEPVVHRESGAKATCELTRKGDTATCTVRWACAAARVEKTMVFRADSPAIAIQYRVRVLRALEQAVYALHVLDIPFRQKLWFYPGRKRHQRRQPTEAYFMPSPGYAYAYDGKTGLGLIGHGDGSLARAVFPSANITYLGSTTPPLRWTHPPYELTLGTSIVMGLEPPAVAALYRRDAKDLKPVQVAELEVEKLIHRSDEKGRASFVLRNNTQQARTVTLEARIEGGIQDVRKLPTQKVELKACSDTAAGIEWAQRGEYGFTLTVSALDSSGKLLDTAREYFAVADEFMRVGQTDVWNAGWMRAPYLIEAKIEQAKRAYHGIIEYYCWAPDQVFDLTPDTEKFEPHTESQGSYHTELTRTFLKDLVRTAHQHGLRMLAMDTGWCSLHGALTYPERVKYTRDGQIYLYGGKFHKGRRFQVAGAHIFTPEAITTWAKEMCASVDMFGWDGVRFDSNLIPIEPQDPLYATKAAVRKKTPFYRHVASIDWFTHDGKSAHKLFPDSDQTAADLVSLYRRTVRKQYPNFVYGVNYSITYGMDEDFPKYTKANCTDTHLQLECLLNITTLYPTWQEWSNILVKALGRLRPYRAQPFVGWMSSYAPGGIAHRYLQYVLMASGNAWNGHSGPRHSIDDSYKQFRHATRFAEYFYDPGFQSLAKTDHGLSVTGNGVDRVLWKPFVFRRDREGRREWLVHLLNLPKDDPIIMHHEIPTPKRNLTVSVKTGPTEKPKACWLLVPGPYPHAVPLRYEADKAGGVSIHVPELLSLGTVVLEMGKGK